MTDTVEFPAWIFRDRRIKPNHIRVLAARKMLGGEPSALDIARETGIDRSDVYRALHDLMAFKLIGEIPLSEQSGKEAETHAAQTLGEIPTSGENPIRRVAPLGSPPKDPGPQNTPPYIPPSPEKVTRAARLPEDWQPSGDDLAYAENIGLREIPRHVEDFRDYWQARAGPEARKLNWSKTWRVRCRTLKGWQDEADRRQGGRGAGGGAAADAQRHRLQSALVSAALAGDVAGDDAGPGFGR